MMRLFIKRCMLFVGILVSCQLLRSASADQSVIKTVADSIKAALKQPPSGYKVITDQASGFALRYGDALCIKHVVSNNHLHATKTAYYHNNSSKQRQISCVDFDKNADGVSWWIIEPCTKDASSLLGKSIDLAQPVRLKHGRTGDYLHSHRRYKKYRKGDYHHAPKTQALQEVTAFLERNNQPGENDAWFIDCIGESGALVQGAVIRLLHAKTACYLRSEPGVTFSTKKDSSDAKYLVQEVGACEGLYGLPSITEIGLRNWAVTSVARLENIIDLTKNELAAQVTASASSSSAAGSSTGTESASTASTSTTTASTDNASTGSSSGATGSTSATTSSPSVPASAPAPAAVTFIPPADFVKLGTVAMKQIAVGLAGDKDDFWGIAQDEKLGLCQFTGEGAAGEFTTVPVKLVRDPQLLVTPKIDPTKSSLIAISPDGNRYLVNDNTLYAYSDVLGAWIKADEWTYIRQLCVEKLGQMLNADKQQVSFFKRKPLTEELRAVTDSGAVIGLSPYIEFSSDGNLTSVVCGQSSFASSNSALDIAAGSDGSVFVINKENVLFVLEKPQEPTGFFGRPSWKEIDNKNFFAMIAVVHKDLIYAVTIDDKLVVLTNEGKDTQIITVADKDATGMPILRPISGVQDLAVNKRGTVALIGKDGFVYKKSGTLTPIDPAPIEAPKDGSPVSLPGVTIQVTPPAAPAASVTSEQTAQPAASSATTSSSTSTASTTQTTPSGTTQSAPAAASTTSTASGTVAPVAPGRPGVTRPTRTAANVGNRSLQARTSTSARRGMQSAVVTGRGAAQTTRGSTRLPSIRGGASVRTPSSRAPGASRAVSTNRGTNRGTGGSRSASPARGSVSRTVTQSRTNTPARSRSSTMPSRSMVSSGRVNSGASQPKNTTTQAAGSPAVTPVNTSN